MYRAAIVGLNFIAADPHVEDLGPPWGPRHAMSHAAAYAEQPHVEVVAVCDLRRDLLEEFAARWSSRWPGLRTYTSVEEMLAREQLDLISVCVPDHLHAQVVIPAAQAGVRGILCEKPLATTLKDADAMIEAVERHGAVMVVGHTRRWVPEFAVARQMIRRGEIGAVRSVEVSWHMPRAMLFRNGTHFVDMMLYLIDGEPRSVLASLPEEFAGYGPRYAGDGGRDPKLDPPASAVITFQSGIRGVFHLAPSPTTLGLFRVVGERGEVVLRTDGGGVAAAELTLVGEDGGAFTRPLSRVHYRHGAIGAAVNELIGLVEGRVATPTSPPQEGRKTLSVCLAILQSAHLGREVRFPIADM